MIALPNPDGSFTCTLFWPFDDTVGFDTVSTGADMRRVCGEQFPDANALMPDLEHEYEHNQTSSLVTMRTGPWHHDGRALLLGDAAHAIVPFLGQGANAALEDVTILMDLYGYFGAENHHQVFETFSRERKPDTDALADEAIEHFVEMRDSVASRWFLLAKRLERVASRLAPGQFIPLYTLISFTRTPYADAVARSKRQDRVLLVSAGAILVVLAAIAVFVLMWLL